MKPILERLVNVTSRPSSGGTPWVVYLSSYQSG